MVRKQAPIKTSPTSIENNVNLSEVPKKLEQVPIRSLVTQSEVEDDLSKLQKTPKQKQTRIIATLTQDEIRHLYLLKEWNQKYNICFMQISDGIPSKEEIENSNEIDTKKILSIEKAAKVESALKNYRYKLTRHVKAGEKSIEEINDFIKRQEVDYNINQKDYNDIAETITENHRKEFKKFIEQDEKAKIIFEQINDVQSATYNLSSDIKKFIFDEKKFHHVPTFDSSKIYQDLPKSAKCLATIIFGGATLGVSTAVISKILIAGAVALAVTTPALTPIIIAAAAITAVSSLVATEAITSKMNKPKSFGHLTKDLNKNKGGGIITNVGILPLAITELMVAVVQNTIEYASMISRNRKIMQFLEPSLIDKFKKQDRIGKDKPTIGKFTANVQKVLKNQQQTIKK